MYTLYTLEYIHHITQKIKDQQSRHTNSTQYWHFILYSACWLAGWSSRLHPECSSLNARGLERETDDRSQHNLVRPQNAAVFASIRLRDAAFATLQRVIQARHRLLVLLLGRLVAAVAIFRGAVAHFDRIDAVIVQAIDRVQVLLLQLRQSHYRIGVQQRCRRRRRRRQAATVAVAVVVVVIRVRRAHAIPRNRGQKAGIRRCGRFKVRR